MTLLLAVAVAVLFGSGAFLLLKPDLFRVVVGIVLVSNAANLVLMASGQTRGDPPIGASDQPQSDALVQAMTLTAIVIGFAVATLLLGLAYRVYTTHETVDLDELAGAEIDREEALEREEITV